MADVTTVTGIQVLTTSEIGSTIIQDSAATDLTTAKTPVGGRADGETKRRKMGRGRRFNGRNTLSAMSKWNPSFIKSCLHFTTCFSTCNNNLLVNRSILIILSYEAKLTYLLKCS